LTLELETYKDIRGYYSGYIYKGYFKAPADAAYRFYVSVDDEAEIYFSNTSKPEDMKLLYKSPGFSSYRGYFRVDGGRLTKWMNLTKDNYYYMEVRMVQYQGGDHLSVAVEIQDPNVTPGHFHTQREIQRLLVDQVLTRETTIVTVNNPDDGLYALGFVDPKTGTNFVGARINTNCSGWELNVAIRDFYSKYYNTYISVEKTMYNADGLVTHNVRNHTKAVYKIQVQKSITSATTNKINI